MKYETLRTFDRIKNIPKLNYRIGALFQNSRLNVIIDVVQCTPSIPARGFQSISPNQGISNNNLLKWKVPEGKSGSFPQFPEVRNIHLSWPDIFHDCIKIVVIAGVKAWSWKLQVHSQDYSDDQIRQLESGLFTSALLTQKYAGRPDLLLERFRQIFSILGNLPVVFCQILARLAGGRNLPGRKCVFSPSEKRTFRFTHHRCI